MFVMLFVPMASAPVMISPDLKSLRFTAVAIADVTEPVVARALSRVPPSWITLSEENVATRPDVAVSVFVMRSLAALVFTIPMILPFVYRF